MKKQKLIHLMMLPLCATLLSGCAATQNEAPGKEETKQETIEKKPKLVKKNTNRKKPKTKIKKQVPKSQGPIIRKASLHLNKEQKHLAKVWKYQLSKKMKMLPLDRYRRAQGSHIQLKESQTPTKKRSAYLTVKPSGWHNIRIGFRKNGKFETSYIYNRGHLVGYQFCGLNNEPRNLITQTAYLNKGSLVGMKSSNIRSQLHYENKIRQWLYTHPNDKVDYSVIPIYKGKELVPRKVLLTYVGLTKHNKRLQIGSRSKYTKIKNKVSRTTLNNTTPYAKINYKTGYAGIYGAKILKPAW